MSQRHGVLPKVDACDLRGGRLSGVSGDEAAIRPVLERRYRVRGRRVDAAAPGRQAQNEREMVNTTVSLVRSL